MNTADEVKLHSPKVLAVQCVVRHCHGENWNHSIDQYRLQALQLLVDLVDLLSIFLRCNGFTSIHKAVVDQTSSRLPNSDHDFFLVQISLGKYFGASSRSNH